jgi:CheY-like chemotaxis protein
MNRILLVEDNPVNQKLALRMLVLLGYNVDIAENGAEALFLLQRHGYAAAMDNGYSAVLMDLQMPVMDGLTATRAIRSLHSDTSRVPIIALTSNSFDTDRQNCLAAGMNDFLSKPINKAQFAAALQHWTAPVPVG